MFETYVTLVGRVVSDPAQHRVGDSGARRCSFRLLAKERRRAGESGDWQDGDKMFVQVTCWRRLAEGVTASIHRGDRVMVIGRLYTREYETDAGPRVSVEVEARAIGPDLSFCTASITRSEWSEPGGPVVDHSAEARPVDSLTAA
jgi:single-strand DNA-binding protein